jgi:hypothetical protein
MYKYLWIYPAPGLPITDASIKTTIHTPITPNLSITMWQKYQCSKIIDPSAPKARALTAEKQDTSPKTAEADKRPTSTTWTPLTKTCDMFLSQASLHDVI